MRTIILIPLLLISFLSFTQKKNEKDAPQVEQTGIASKTKGMKSLPGYFNFFYDESRTRRFS